MTGDNRHFCIGRSNKQQTDGEEEIRGNREYAWTMCLGGKGTKVNIGGEIGGTRDISEDGKRTYNPK